MNYYINLYFEYYPFTFPITGIFLVILFRGNSDEPTLLREDEIEQRARSWTFEFIRKSTDKEEIVSHGRVDEGYEIHTKDKYGEDKEYFVIKDE